MTAPAIYRLLIVLAGVTVLGGCFSMQELPNYPLVVAEEVNVGDKVEITEMNGRVIEMEVEAVSEVALTGAGETIAYEDMSAIAVRRYDDRKTAKIIGGTILIVALPFALEGLAGGNHIGNVN